MPESAPTPFRRALRATLALAFVATLGSSIGSNAADEPATLGGAYARIAPGPIPAYALMLVAPDDAPLAVHALTGAPATLGDLTVPARLYDRAGDDARAAFAAWVDEATDAVAREPDPRGTDGRTRLRAVLDDAVGADAVRVAPDREPVVVAPGGAIGLLLTPLAIERRGGHADAAFEPVVRAAIGDGQVREFPLFGPVRWPAWP